MGRNTSPILVCQITFDSVVLRPGNRFRHTRPFWKAESLSFRTTPTRGTCLVWSSRGTFWKFCVFFWITRKIVSQINDFHDDSTTQGLHLKGACTSAVDAVPLVGHLWPLSLRHVKGQHVNEECVQGRRQTPRSFFRRWFWGDTFQSGSGFWDTTVIYYGSISTYPHCMLQMLYCPTEYPLARYTAGVSKLRKYSKPSSEKTTRSLTTPLHTLFLYM